MLEIIDGNSSYEYIATIRELFEEYIDSLGFELDFQDYRAEIASLPGKYSFPEGALLIAMWGGQAAGCIAMRPLDDRICEMKRLYVRPSFRGRGIARSLVSALITLAKNKGYSRMRLDTMEDIMAPAIRLYESLGFYDILPYCFNPMKSARFMELELPEA